jgi:hypothetical protein
VRRLYNWGIYDFCLLSLAHIASRTHGYAHCDVTTKNNEAAVIELSNIAVHDGSDSPPAMPANPGAPVVGLLYDCFLQSATIAPSRRQPNPITWATGGNVPLNRLADAANLAPGGPHESPSGGRRDGAA